MQSEFRAVVVDDEEAVRALAARALSDEGFRCDQAADGQEAEGLLEQGRYDVVVTDLRMPRENGHALATKILARRPRPVIVILTGVLEPSLAEDLIARGADEILFKPVDYKEFASKVKQLVAYRTNDDGAPNGKGDERRERHGWLGWFSARFHGLSPEECLPALELLDAEGPLSLQQLRDRLVISLALHGLNPIEISGLKVSDLQLSTQCDSVSVVRKEGVRYATRLNYQSAQCIRDYLQSSGHRNDPEALLLQPLPDEAPQHKLGHLPPSAIERLLSRYIVSVK